MLRENESTMNIQTELNKLDLCFNNDEQILFNNVIILEHYKEYRTEQKLFSKIQHYEEIYKLKQIYNENLLEYFDCDCNNDHTSIFNIYNLILFCGIIIILLLFYKLK